jgi:nicotinamidase-related amidase
LRNPCRRALLIVDVQNEYLDGNLRIEYPDPKRSLRNIERAMLAAREAAIPVIVVQNTGPVGSPIFAPGSAGWALHPSVGRQPRDHYVEKRLPSAFAGTDLAQWLERHLVDTLCLSGYMTHNCIAATAFQALHAGLAVEVLSDATGSVPYANGAGRASARDIHQAFCVVFQSRFAAVATTERWIAAVRSGSALPRDTIYASNQNALLAQASS